MGHVSKTPAGSFRANWRDPAGQQKAKTFKTKKEASAFLADTEASMNRGSYIDPKVGKLVFGAYAKRWLAGRHVEIRTSERTLSVMRIHVLPKWSAWPLAKIDHLAVQEWVSWLSAHKRLAPASVAKCFGALSMVLASAVRARLIPFNPCEGVNLPSTHKPQRASVALAQDEFFGRLLPAVPADHRALVAVAAGAGMRWGEAVGLPWNAVDFDSQVLRVVQVVVESGGMRTIKTYPKSRAGIRSIPMPSFLTDALTARKEALGAELDPTSLVFTNRNGLPPLRSTFRREVWRPSLVRAGLLGAVVEIAPHKWRATWPDDTGLDWDKEFTTERDAVIHVAEHAVGGLRYHDLRHSYATWLVTSGVPVNIVQRVMGHESASTTLNLYTHAPSEFEKRVRDVFDAAADDSLTSEPE